MGKNSNKPPKEPKKRGRKSKAEKELCEPEKTRLQQQVTRPLEDNVKDLPSYCDWGSKLGSNGKPFSWCGYKLHIATGDGGVVLGAILISALLHDSQVAISLTQKVNERAIVLYDLADSAYDTTEIKIFSSQIGHIPIIDKNKRRGESVPCDPVKKNSLSGTFKC